MHVTTKPEQQGPPSYQGDAAQQRLDEARAWLTAALAPYVDGEPIDWALRLDPCAALSGSYAWSTVALLPGESQTREIELWRRKHYEPGLLAKSLGSLGWAQVAACRYRDAQPGELHVYRRGG